MSRGLLFGFEPFGGETLNISWEAVRAFDEKKGLVARRLPVSYARAGPAIRAALEEVRPDFAIAFGMGHRLFPLGGMACVERIALNVAGGDRADNDGEAPSERPIDPAGPLAFLSTLPADAILTALKRAGIPARRSFHAGTYLCNHTMYTLLRWGKAPAGFIHLPPHPTRNRRNGCFTTGQARRAVRVIVEAVAREMTRVRRP